MVRKMSWKGLQSALRDLGVMEEWRAMEGFPETPSDEFLQQLHHVLFEVHVQDGTLVCPTTGRSFPVKDGIPNMLLHEDEV
jgi:multifunctional methyltransferase subunit TRM112